jgi:hypothetical protein
MQKILERKPLIGIVGIDGMHQGVLGSVISALFDVVIQ